MCLKKYLGVMIAALLSSIGFVRGAAVVPTIVATESMESVYLNEHYSATSAMREALKTRARNGRETTRLAGPNRGYCRP
jgi:hypothetical protein